MTETPTAETRTVVVPASIDMVSVLGPGDEHLRLVERSFRADVHVRGNRITLAGDPERPPSWRSSSTRWSPSSAPGRA